jgi:carbon storage regulator
MLVLSRKEGEEINLTGNINIKVLTIAGRVKLGITAPPEIKVLRAEVAEIPTPDSRIHVFVTVEGGVIGSIELFKNGEPVPAIIEIKDMD